MSNTVLELAEQLHHARAVEGAAKARREQIEQQIVDALEFRRPEGQQTFDVIGDRGVAKIRLKRNVSTSVDAEAWERIRRKLPRRHPARDLFRVSYDLSLAEARKFQESDRDGWALISDAITRKPGKVSVELIALATAGEAGIADPSEEDNRGD